MTYEQIKKRHKLTDSVIGKWFGYKTAQSFSKSTKYPKIVSGIESLYKLILLDKENSKENFKQIINKEIEKL